MKPRQPRGSIISTTESLPSDAMKISGTPLGKIKDKFELLHLWLPYWLWKPYQALFNLIKTIVSTLLCLRLPIYTIEFDSQESHSRINYLGGGTYWDFIKNLAGQPAPDLVILKYTSLWHVKAAIQQMEGESCLLVELPVRIGSYFLKQDGILVIPRIRWQIATDRPWEQIEGDFHQSSVKNDLDKLRKSRLQAIVSHDRKELEHFYWEVYYPNMIIKPDALSNIAGFEQVRQAFRRGWLTWYQEDGQILGGSVQYLAGKTYIMDCLGYAHNLTSQQYTNVSTAAYYLNFRRAWEMGAKAIDLTLSYPLMGNGLVRYKSKWGGTIAIDTVQNWGLWISPNIAAGKALPFLLKQPWIWVDRQKRLKGLLVVEERTAPLDQTDLDALCLPLWVRGLDSIIVHSPAGFAPELSPTAGPFPSIGPAVSWQPGEGESLV